MTREPYTVFGSGRIVANTFGYYLIQSDSYVNVEDA